MPLRIVLSLVTLAACGPATIVPTTDDPTNPGPTDPGTPPGPPGDVGAIGSWASCQPLTSQMAAGPECLSFEVPLRWALEGTDPTIEMTVYRYLTDDPEPKGQVWALDGGPGGSGAGPGNPAFVDQLNGLGFDLYIPSQRGTSGPDMLECGNPNDLPACHAELVDTYTLDGLAGFVTGEAALDTQLALEHADEGTPQLLFGTSYGTYLAMRILQIDDAIDGVVLDSSMTLDPDIWNAGLYAHDAVVDLFEACGADADCAAHFPGPVEDAIALIGDDAHCPEIAVDGRGGLIGFTTQMAPVLPVAMTARLARCDEEDVDVFARLESLVGQFPPGATWPFPSEGALNNVVYSTVVAHDFLPPLTQEVYEQALSEAAGLAFGNDQATRHFWSMRNDFPVGAGFEVDRAVPDALPPILVLQGGQDQQTPPAWGERAADSLGGTLVTIHDAGHGVYPQSDCAQQITDAFLLNPGATLDRGCAESQGGPSLEEPDDPYVLGFIQFALGITQIWP